MIRFNEDLDRELCFIFQVKGPVTEENIVNTIKNKIPKLRSIYNINKLQENGIIGNIRVLIDRENNTPGSNNAYNYKLKNLTKGYLYVPTGMELSKKGVFSTLIEEIKRVSSFESKFKFYCQRNLTKENYAQRLSRSIEIVHEINKTESEEEDWEKAITDAISKKNIINYGIHAFGTDFYKLKNVFVVEGKNDLLKMLNIGYSNVMSLGGFKFEPKDVAEYLKDKSVIAFCDGDVGGINNVRKLSECCNIEYIVPLRKHQKLEDLDYVYIMRLISKRILFDKDMVKIGKEIPFSSLIKERSDSAWSGLYEAHSNITKVSNEASGYNTSNLQNAVNSAIESENPDLQDDKESSNEKIINKDNSTTLE